MPATKTKKKTKNKKKFKVRIRWGEADTRRGSYSLEDPNDCSKYEFDTEAERSAFLYGINEADGWLGCDVYDSDHKCESCPKDGGTCVEGWDDEAEDS